MKKRRLEEYYEQTFKVFDALGRRVAAMPEDVEAHQHEHLLEVLREFDKSLGFMRDIFQAEMLDSNKADPFFSSSFGCD